MSYSPTTLFCRAWALLIIGFALTFAGQNAAAQLKHESYPGGLTGQNKVDWYEGAITAEGYGFVRKEVTPNPARRKLMARQAAINDANRTLGEMINGLSVRGTTTVKDAIVKNDRIETVLKGFIQGAQVIETRYDETGGPDSITSCSVVMRAPLAGPDGLARYLLPFVREQMHGPLYEASDIENMPMDPSSTDPGATTAPPVKVQPAPADPPKLAPQETAFMGAKPGKKVGVIVAPDGSVIAPDATTNKLEDAEPGTTGILFDARRVDIGWSLFPAVETENGFSIYDVTLLPASALEGYFSPYAFTIDKGREHERTRTDPLVVLATDESEGTLIISNEDGKRLLEMDEETNLLRRGRVIFVILPDDASLPE